MAKEFAKGFYSSKLWQDCRDNYAASRQHLCENCLARGIYKPGVIVHHVEELTPMNITNPEVSLNHGNLRLLCRDCHAIEHKGYSRGRRFFFDENGNVKIFSEPPLSRHA